jgi:hypothetical protein
MGNLSRLREYRDKWVAHWDLDRIPVTLTLEVAKKAAWFYQSYVCNHEPVGVTWDIESAHEHFEREADAVYRTAAQRAN